MENKHLDLIHNIPKDKEERYKFWAGLSKEDFKKYRDQIRLLNSDMEFETSKRIKESNRER